MSSTTVRCESAEEFLEAIAPVSFHLKWACRDEDLLLFRGCRDANYALMPSALRGGGAPRTLAQQVQCEINWLARFASDCDEQGLPIPNDNDELRARIIHLTQLSDRPLLTLESGVRWPTDAWLALMALAQHHGLPTRFLDWTTNPYVAAYFASRPTIKRVVSSGGIYEREAEAAEGATLAVWALTPFGASIKANYEKKRNPMEVRFMCRRSVGKFTWMGKGDWRGFALVDVTRAGNSNLIAQRGYLTSHVLGAVPPEKWDVPWEEFPLEQQIREMDTEGAPRLLKFELGAEHIPALRAYLKKYGVTTASMFPGYAGVATGLLERTPSDQG